MDEDDDDIFTKKRKLSLRRVTYPLTISREIRTFGEYCAATKYHSAFLSHLGGNDALDTDGNLPASSRAVSTISVAFSPDGYTMASTHGDHTVKLTCCSTGRLLQSLEGHPRTPWTVKYHPTDARILASGCLGHQVRVWNWETKACLQMIRLEFSIVSLSFHPSGTVLAIANGTHLHFWGIDDIEPTTSSACSYHDPSRTVPSPSLSSSVAATNSSVGRAARLTDMDQRHMLRCVHFPSDGTTLIVGGVNPMTEDPRLLLGNPGGGGGMSFYLRLWDFDLQKAVEVTPDTAAGGVVAPVGISAARRAISKCKYYTFFGSCSSFDWIFTDDTSRQCRTSISESFSTSTPW
jgi:activating molecule in BECN1-regulated autophagy protein 1